MLPEQVHLVAGDILQGINSQLQISDGFVPLPRGELSHRISEDHRVSEGRFVPLDFLHSGLQVFQGFAHFTCLHLYVRESVYVVCLLADEGAWLVGLLCSSPDDRQRFLRQPLGIGKVDPIGCEGPGFSVQCRRPSKRRFGRGTEQFLVILHFILECRRAFVTDARGLSSKTLNLLHAPADPKPPRGPVESRDMTAVKGNISKRGGTNIRYRELYILAEQRPLEISSIKFGARE